MQAACPTLKVTIIKDVVKKSVNHESISEPAHIADYLRIDIVNKYGGIYLDTDVIVLKDFDDFLHNPLTLGMEFRSDPMFERASIWRADKAAYESVAFAMVASKPDNPTLHR